VVRPVRRPIRSPSASAPAGGGAAHRGTDKGKEVSDLESVNAACMARAHELLEASPSMRLFLLTDSIQTVGALRRELRRPPDCDRMQRADGPVGVHMQPGLPDGGAWESRCSATYTWPRGATGSSALGCPNIACMIQHLKNWPTGACELLGRNLHERPWLPFTRIDALRAGTTRRGMWSRPYLRQ